MIDLFLKTLSSESRLYKGTQRLNNTLTFYNLDYKYSYPYICETIKANIMYKFYHSVTSAIGLIITLIVLINMTEIELKLMLIISIPLVLFFGCLLIDKLTKEN